MSTTPHTSAPGLAGGSIGPHDTVGLAGLLAALGVSVAVWSAVIVAAIMLLT